MMRSVAGARSASLFKIGVPSELVPKPSTTTFSAHLAYCVSVSMARNRDAPLYAV
jgi:hypothetical protein